MTQHIKRQEGKGHRCISRRKARRAHFQAPSHVRRLIMSSRLCKDLRAKHDVRAMPIRKGDDVKVLRGKFKGKEGKVEKVYRLRWCIHIDKCQKEKSNSSSVAVPIHSSNVEILKLKTTKHRTEILERKRSGNNKASPNTAANIAGKQQAAAMVD